MSNDRRKDPKLTQDTTDNLEESDASSHAGDSASDLGDEPLHASLEDTGESSSLQEQENPVTQNNDAVTASAEASKQLPKPLPGSIDAVSEELRYYASAMNDYLTWKENLRITSVDLQIGGPYFELWTKEANLFFRRLVILRKRIESIKKQKRA